VDPRVCLDGAGSLASTEIRSPYRPARSESLYRLSYPGPLLLLLLLFRTRASGVPRNFVQGVQQIQLRTKDRERGSGEGSPLVRGSGGRCNLVQEISFHIVKLS